METENLIKKSGLFATDMVESLPNHLYQGFDAEIS